MKSFETVDNRFDPGSLQVLVCEVLKETDRVGKQTLKQYVEH